MGEKAPRSWYPILMIIMCIRLVLQAAVSFRAAPKTVHIAFSQFDAVKEQRIPSYKTITRWLTQVGLYKLNCPKEQADDWGVIVDNSIQIGSHKCIVVLGVRLSKFQGRALTLEDMDILVMKISDKLDAQMVCTVLEEAKRKVGKIVMVCADNGSDLRGGIQLFCTKYGVGRVFDIIHKIGTFLKRALENDPEWKAFCSAATEAKKKMQQTQAAHLVPPNQRTKSRFLNIEILVRWGIDILVALETPNHPDRKLLEEYCGWIRQHYDLLEKLKQFDLISQNVRQHIREHGICIATGDNLEKILEAIMKAQKFNFAAYQYAGDLIEFINDQSKIVPLGQVWIGTSEIIESLFGKLKCLEQDQCKGGFTSLVLGAAACVGKVDVDVVSAALRQVRTVDIDKWMREQIEVTLLSKRRNALGAYRKKRLPEGNVQDTAGILQEEAVGF
jgi:hypothetical protein